jgi:hypothetical protein
VAISQGLMLDWEGYQLTWTNLKPRFQHQLATQRDDKLIIKGLSNLAMRPNELKGKLLVRITNTMVIIKDSYATYQNRVLALLQHDASGGYLNATATKWENDSVNNAVQFFQMQLFQVDLPREIQKVVAQHDQTTMTLDVMYWIMTTTQSDACSKKSTKLSQL